MKIKLKKGILISIEGIDGSGKSILCKNLEKYLCKKYEALITKEPGGSNLGKKLREILQNKKVCPMSEYLLYAADRAQHFNELVIPALRESKLVLSDRMADSSIAYQGYGREIDINLIELVNNKTMQSIKPDLVLYLDIDLETSRKRINARNERLTIMEQEKIGFMQKVKYAFDTIFKDKNNVKKIDAKQSPEEILEQTINIIDTWIQQNDLIV